MAARSGATVAAIAFALLAAAAIGWLLLAGGTPPAPPPGPPPAAPGDGPPTESPAPALPVPSPAPIAPSPPPVRPENLVPPPQPARGDEEARARLDALIDSLRLESATLLAAIEEVGRKAGLETTFDSEQVRVHCSTRRVNLDLRDVPARRALDVLLGQAGPDAVDGKPLGWALKDGRLVVGVVERKPEPDVLATGPEAAARLLDRLRSERVSVAFENEPMSNALRALAAKAGVNIVADPADVPRDLKLSLTATDSPIVDVLDGLVAFLPGTHWEAKSGNLVRISKK